MIIFIFVDIINMIKNVFSLWPIHVFMASVIFGVAYFLLRSLTNLAAKTTDFQLFALASVAGACLPIVRKIFP